MAPARLGTRVSEVMGWCFVVRVGFSPLPRAVLSSKQRFSLCGLCLRRGKSSVRMRLGVPRKSGGIGLVFRAMVMFHPILKLLLSTDFKLFCLLELFPFGFVSVFKHGRLMA